ncbi:MAG: exodeoxyribonuclease-3 [Candidatus Latescibacterota bacterium]
MKLISWNVNGIRSVARKGFHAWLGNAKPDVLSLQETRAWPEQLEEELLAPLGYKSYFACAQKKGYSGVAIYSRNEPLEIIEGLGDEQFDGEGRTLTARFEDFSLVNAYFPNGQRDHARVPYKMDYCRAFLSHCQELRARGQGVVMCGDFNTAHCAIDLARPKDNKNTTGFLELERAWIDELIDAGYVDIFRAHNPDATGHYTWWSNRQGVRERNIGWRIDYHFVSECLETRIKKVYHLPEVFGSDHCPLALELK